MSETQRQVSQWLVRETMLRNALAGIPATYVRDILPDLLAQRFGAGGQRSDVPTLMDLGHRICRKADELSRED